MIVSISRFMFYLVILEIKELRKENLELNMQVRLFNKDKSDKPIIRQEFPYSSVQKNLSSHNDERMYQTVQGPPKQGIKSMKASAPLRMLPRSSSTSDFNKENNAKPNIVDYRALLINPLLPKENKNKNIKDIIPRNKVSFFAST